MNWFRKHAIALGGTAVAVSLLTLTAPRAAHALVVALVQVTNTVATPAITQDVSKLASQNVQLHCIGFTDCSQVSPRGIFAGVSYAVPDGHSLVITTVQINASTASAIEVQLQIAIPDGEGLLPIGSWNLSAASAAGSVQFQYPSGIVVPFRAILRMNVNLQSDNTYLTGYLVSN